MAHLKVHVGDNNTATLICPACGAVKHFAADRYRHSRHTISVRCRCQQVFSLLLDFRRHYRKQTSLPGTYEILSEGGVGAASSTSTTFPEAAWVSPFQGCTGSKKIRNCRSNSSSTTRKKPCSNDGCWSNQSSKTALVASLKTLLKWNGPWDFSSTANRFPLLPLPHCPHPVPGPTRRRPQARPGAAYPAPAPAAAPACPHPRR